MEDLKIEIGGIIENTFDYSPPPQDLDRQLSARIERVKRGEIKPTHELSMLGYALDFIDFAQQNMNIAMNFDEENLENFCGILGALKRSFSQNPPPKDFLDGCVKGAVGFFGVMIIKNLGGNWLETNVGISITVNGTAAFISNRIAGFFSVADENENAIAEIFDYLKNKSGAANAE